jgi:hypothetical protein
MVKDTKLYGLSASSIVMLTRVIDALEIQPTATENEIKKAYRKVTISPYCNRDLCLRMPLACFEIPPRQESKCR